MEKKISEVDQEMKKLEKFRFLLDEEKMHRIKVIQSKDREMEILFQNKSNLEKEVDELKKMLEADK